MGQRTAMAANYAWTLAFTSAAGTLDSSGTGWFRRLPFECPLWAVRHYVVVLGETLR